MPAAVDTTTRRDATPLGIVMVCASLLACAGFSVAGPRPSRS